MSQIGKNFVLLMINSEESVASVSVESIDPNIFPCSFVLDILEIEAKREGVTNENPIENKVTRKVRDFLVIFTLHAQLIK